MGFTVCTKLLSCTTAFFVEKKVKNIYS